jgi:hypothetical protein
LQDPKATQDAKTKPADKTKAATAPVAVVATNLATPGAGAKRVRAGGVDKIAIALPGGSKGASQDVAKLGGPRTPGARNSRASTEIATLGPIEEPPPGPQSHFLHAAHGAGCRIFGTTLGLAEEFGAEEDNQAFNGTGVPFVGVLNASGVNTSFLGGSSTSGKTTIGSATIDDMIDAADKTSEDADDAAVYVFNKALKSVLRKVKVTNTYAWAEAAKDVPGTLNGYPWYTSKKLPNAPAVNTAFAIYGNFGYAFLGDREQMTIAITREGTIGSDNLFEQNMAGLRITERIAIDVAVPSAFTVIKTAAS